MLRTKPKIKLLLALGIMLLAVLVFNMNTVNAAPQEETIQPMSEIKIILQNEIEQDIFEYNVFGSMVDFRYGKFAMDDLLLNTSKLNSLVQSDGYIYQSIYIELDNNIDEVAIKETNKKLDIININGKNYAKYDMKVIKKENNKFINIEDNTKICIQCKTNSQVKIEQEITFCVSTKHPYMAMLEIVDENDKYIGKDQFGYDTGKCMLGEENWSETRISTSFDYSNAYYRLTLNVNVGSSIYIDDLGTFNFTNTNKEAWNDWGVETTGYIYKMKIKDTSLLSKAQNKTFNIKLVEVNTNREDYCVIDFGIKGETRQTYTINDTAKNIGISLNGATETGVSLKADTLDENNSTYIEMANTVLNNNDYIVIGAYDIKLTGKYEGELLLTFDLGIENNGKKVRIWHKKADESIETFNKVVTNGKVTITVTELSPFLLAYENTTSEKETTPNTENIENTEKPSTTTKLEHKKDDTPKTGTTASIYFIIPVTVMSAIGIIAFRRKETK